ncbi:MAG: DUF3108 domain-containing protein [Alphaproteobacteria bacterium]|nr:DUF3108 domain-containing protein [Alphaproteobacteria bacterium]
MTFQRLALVAALSLCAALPAPMALAAGGAAGADTATPPDSRLEVAMALYAGGVSLGKVDLDATVRGDEYRVVSHLQTEGVLNAFWKATIQATSSGSIGAGSVTPALYDSFAIRGDGKKQQVSLTYSNHAPKLFADPAYPVTGYEVTEDEKKNTFDPLSTVMNIVTGALAQGGSGCNVTAPVFDGRRRYNIEMNKVRDVDVKLDNGLYKGKGVLCQIHYKQIAGYRPTLLRNKDAYPVINAWLAPFKSGSRQYLVPLKVWAETSFGPVTAVANSLKVDGAPPKRS